MPPVERIAADYRRFAEVEAAGRSPAYAEIAARVARDPAALAFLAALPRAKRQPNLLFGAVQYLRGALTTWDLLADTLQRRADDLLRVMSTHTTQTNVPARCATLLPALAALPPPLALLEVGASAGLCLYPDRYGYDFDGHRLAPTATDAPTFHCTASPGTPLPHRPLEVVWRAGLDLHPLDVENAEDRSWLRALVWPGEERVAAELEAALEVARREPPHLVAGDLTTDLPALLAAAPPGATLVVFHTAVLAYVEEAGARRRFADTVTASRATWIANETPARIPGIVGWTPEGQVVAEHPPGEFVLCRDAVPLARTDPHGRRITWLRDTAVAAPADGLRRAEEP